ncbi:MAG: DUF1735 domain-containing protein [Bacteroidales bacterium]|nr:DUF1735 domain-containing protein [Bacteroidales bacterium]
MKKILILLSCALLFSACSDELRVMLDIPEADTYTSVYMPKATMEYCTENIFISEDLQYFQFSAFYGGPKLPSSDIRVEFETRLDLVDSYNETHGTEYKPIPEDAVNIPCLTGTIKAGCQYTDMLDVEITTVGKLAVAEPYLLPIAIKSVNGDEAKANETLSVTYYLVAGSYLPGQVPRTLVYDFGHEFTNPIFCRGTDLIAVNDEDNLELFRADESGVFQSVTIFGWGWGGLQIMFYMPDDRIIIRNQWDNITQYWFNSDYAYCGQADIGWGWGGCELIFPFKDLALIAVDDGTLSKYPLGKDGTFDFGNCSAIGWGWDIFQQLFCYENYLIGIESNGVMAAYTFADDYTIGTRRNIGTGWGEYAKVFPCGKDLLALDHEGKLWRYQFNPTAYWPLAEK